jgi:hypothetical protein
MNDGETLTHVAAFQNLTRERIITSNPEWVGLLSKNSLVNNQRAYVCNAALCLGDTRE